MKRFLLLLAPFLVLGGAACAPGRDPGGDVARWERRARDVRIVRDDWGVPHVYGTTDADAVFGLVYAQAEDDFNRVEVNFLNSMGRLAEAEGEEEIWRDLRMRLFIDPAEMKAEYEAAPAWLRALMDAWADGLNYYLHTHPEVRPRVLTRFEPWMALTFSEGSIGGDIERVSLRELEAFYEARSGGAPVAARDAAASGRLAGVAAAPPTASATRFAGSPSAATAPTSYEIPAEPTGSNGIAIAPANTRDGHALLLINPHTSFFFRAEAHVVSEEGLNAYGAVTWGQFFVYQGFNDRAGWMHTSSGVDNIDEYLETVTERDGALVYRYGDEERPVTSREVVIRYRDGDGLAERSFTIHRTHHGPVVREEDGRWVSVRLMEKPLEALTQSYLRTKARSYEEFLETMRLHTNSSNNTVFADADGNIAYLHSNFIPWRDTSIDWSRPVDGSDPTTEWGDPLPVEESPNAVNPPNGWVQNTNNWPYSAAGAHSPRKEDYAPYVQRSGENARGAHALLLLEGRAGVTLDGLLELAFDSHLPLFEELVPGLVRAWERAPGSDPLRARLADPISALGAWDFHWGVESVPTALAVFWGDELVGRIADAARRAGASPYDYMAERATDRQRLEALAAAVDRLEADFGSWRTPWGDINRFQRITGDIVQPFDDGAPSAPVGFVSGRWGSLASFGARRFGTRRLYGTSGNSFVAVVEFADRVRALAVTAGGQNGDPASPHFDDQTERYATGDLRPVYFHPDELEGHVEREYRPGG